MLTPGIITGACLRSSKIIMVSDLCRAVIQIHDSASVSQRCGVYGVSIFVCLSLVPDVRPQLVCDHNAFWFQCTSTMYALNDACLLLCMFLHWRCCLYRPVNSGTDPCAARHKKNLIPKFSMLVCTNVWSTVDWPVQSLVQQGTILRQ